MTEQTPGVSLSIVSRVVREPTLHFALLAAVLFGATTFVGSRNGDVIEIDRDQIVLRIRQLEAVRGAPLSQEERLVVEDAYINERVLVREAKALGLEEDARIDDVLVQKMMHVLSADVIQPTQAELEAYYADNQVRYVPESSVTIDGAAPPGGGAQSDATPLPFDVVKDLVRLDWIGEREQDRLDDRIAELRGGYSVVYDTTGSGP